MSFLIFLIILLIAIVAAIYFTINVYNSLIVSKNQVQNSLANINVVLNKRYDLIPNLVAVCQKYMQHEQDTLLKVTEARTGAISNFKDAQDAIQSGMFNESMYNLFNSENSLAKSLAGLNISIEAYPELKANEEMLNLQNQLSDIENELSTIRSNFNYSVTSYNNTAQQFPNNIISKYFNFHPIKWLEIEDIETKKNAPKIDFS